MFWYDMQPVVCDVYRTLYISSQLRVLGFPWIYFWKLTIIVLPQSCQSSLGKGCISLDLSELSSTAISHPIRCHMSSLYRHYRHYKVNFSKLIVWKLLAEIQKKIIFNGGWYTLLINSFIDWFIKKNFRDNSECI